MLSILFTTSHIKKEIHSAVMRRKWPAYYVRAAHYTYPKGDYFIIFMWPAILYTLKISPELLMAVFHLFQGHNATSPLEKSVTISYVKNTIDICKYMKQTSSCCRFFSLFTLGFFDLGIRWLKLEGIFGLCTKVSPACSIADWLRAFLCLRVPPFGSLP